MTHQPDPIQAAIDTIAYMSMLLTGEGLLPAAVLAGEVRNPDDIIEQLRAHQQPDKDAMQILRHVARLERLKTLTSK